jgi:adenylate cyclase
MLQGLANFERFTNRAVVNLARKGMLSLGGVYKNATVCFALIRNFSELAGELSAKETVDFINDYMRRMVPCITASGGIVDKFLTQGGVVVMALWGTVETAGNPAADALACIRATIAMRAELRELNRERLSRGLPLIKTGCGINSGEVISGQMGSQARMEFTVVGDTVNLAARMEGPNDLFDTDILITENTLRLIKNILITKEMPSLEIKGKEKPLRVFAVVNLRDRLGPRTLEELRRWWRPQ